MSSEMIQPASSSRESCYLQSHFSQNTSCRSNNAVPLWVDLILWGPNHTNTAHAIATTGESASQPFNNIGFLALKVILPVVWNVVRTVSSVYVLFYMSTTSAGNNPWGFSRHSQAGSWRYHPKMLLGGGKLLGSAWRFLFHLTQVLLQYCLSSIWLGLVVPTELCLVM